MTTSRASELSDSCSLSILRGYPSRERPVTPARWPSTPRTGGEDIRAATATRVRLTLYIGHGMGRGTHLARGVRVRLAFAMGLCALTVGPLAAQAAARNFDNPADNTPAAAQQQFGITNPHRNDTPNDPGYDGAEPDDPDAVGSTNLFDEAYGLFG